MILPTGVALLEPLSMNGRFGGAKRAARSTLRLLSRRWVTADRIASDLKNLGVDAGRLLLVHSSLSSLGHVRGGASAVIDALLACVGASGTLVMPTHSWDRSGRGDFTFDVRNTPSCVGAITDSFRTICGESRSLHPTHSVAAIGPKADYLTRSHETAATPCGPGTPYAKLVEDNCQILFLGTTLDQNTLFHFIEAIANLPYLLKEADEQFLVTDWSGASKPMSFRRHNRGPERRFGETQPLFAGQGILQEGRVGQAHSLLVECAPMVASTLAELRKNPRYLLA